MNNYKELSQIISKQHKEAGISLHPIFDSIDHAHFINLSTEETISSHEGKELSPKKIRKYLWENKKDRKFQRKNAVLWTAYDSEEDISYIGIGASTHPEVSSRLNAEILWEQKDGS